MLDKVIYIYPDWRKIHNWHIIEQTWSFIEQRALVLKRYWNLHQWKNKDMNATQAAVIFVSCRTEKDCEHKEKNISTKISVTFFKSTKHWYLQKETRWSSMHKLESFRNTLEMAGPKLTDAISPANLESKQRLGSAQVQYRWFYFLAAQRSCFNLLFLEFSSLTA